MPKLTINALGPLSLSLAGQPLTGLDYRKVRALLVRLAVEADRAHTRAELCGQLWPEVDERAARASLSQAVSQLRKALGDKQATVPFLQVSIDTLQLNPEADVTVDVHTFLAALQQAERHVHVSWHTCAACSQHLRDGLSVYRGDFLDNFFLTDSAPFEEWAVVWRERLRARALTALERLIQRAEWCGDFVGAIELARRMIALDPISETAWRETMRLLALNGEAAAAEAQFEQYRRRWASELQLEPDPATLKLIAQVCAGERETLRRLGPAPEVRSTAPGPFIGRATESAALQALVLDPGTRLVTVVGSPGLGKTRLAEHVAEALRYDFEHGVVLVALAPLAEPALVLAAIAAALGVKDQARTSLIEALKQNCARRHLLLVLDNFEHVLDAAPLVADLLGACPRLKVLVTSRSPLEIRAEITFPLDPLSAHDARILFLTRAAAAAPGVLTSDAATDEAIAAICDRVDHLPLAIELAAGRLRATSLSELRQQLQLGLDALGTGPRDLPERQRTLRASIAWSYQRLAPEAQRAFARLSVFAGGFTPDAADAVLDQATDPGPRRTPAALPASTTVVASLVAASLIQARNLRDTTRFTLLETLRDFAHEQLSAAEREASRERHAAYFQDLADQAYAALLGPDQGAWGQRVSEELDNLRAAVRWAQTRGQIERVLRIATGVFRFFWQRGLLREGLSWFEPALARRHEAPLDVQSRALRAAGVLAWSLSDYPRAVAWNEAAIDAGRQLGSADLISAATTNLGLVLKEQGEWERANAVLAEAVALNRAVPDQPHRVKFALVIRAGLLLRLGKWAEADAAYAEALSHNRAVGDVEGTANALYGLAVTASARGEVEPARRGCAESLALYTSLNHQYGIGWVHYHWGLIELDAGDLDRANALLEHSLRIWLEREDEANTAHVLDALAQVLGRRGRWGQAAQWLSAADRIRSERQATLTPFEAESRAALIKQALAALGPTAFEAAWAAGRASTPRDWAI